MHLNNDNMGLWDKYPEIGSEIREVEKLIMINVKSRNSMLTKLCAELAGSGGKRIRPAFVIIASRFGEFNEEKVRSLAAALEILHTATLIHDDVIDRAVTRRGRATAAALYGADMAIYMGDFLFTKAVLLLMSAMDGADGVMQQALKQSGTYGQKGSGTEPEGIAVPENCSKAGSDAISRGDAVPGGTAIPAGGTIPCGGSIYMPGSHAPMFRPDLAAKAVKTICEGEVDQYRQKFDTDISALTYLKRIYRKTAVLFSTSCMLGALSAGCPAGIAKRLGKFGLYYGMAFQIKDDLNDFISEESVEGKPVIKDISEGIFTLPVIYAISNDSDFRRFMKAVTEKSRTGIKGPDLIKAVSMVRNTGGIERSIGVLDKYVARGAAALSGLPRNRYTGMLHDMLISISTSVKLKA